MRWLAGSGNRWIVGDFALIVDGNTDAAVGRSCTAIKPT